MLFRSLNLFIYLFLAVLGLRLCAWAFSSCGEWGLLFVAVLRLLVVVASLIADKFIYLFMAALGLRCCARAFSSFSKQGLLFIVVRGLLIAVASLVADHVWASVVVARRLSSCGTRA